MKTLSSIGFFIAYAGVAIILIWIGVYKFTPTEAAAIKPLVSNHFLLFWLYDILSDQGVSNLFGIIEIISGILIIIAPFIKVIRILAGLAIVITFLFTLSFLFTTPGIWKVVDGIGTINFFMLKDLPMLGLGLIYIAMNPFKSK
ncbi:hypothetical protein BKH43_05655 [Helicobacter sp. 13S00401-1]|uniref:DUF417 family protein n=1 Tax=Helicobacter sp. 13S00401-1 TaxID=1905758 RepID=UPI000BA53009|nr:DUF417 family protein [Helicobacter sp. 13S00401-1]PAF50095.1 hypothetical protein BKH43_05655 [Helicobacter sp. 13S00401-1]